MEPAPAAPRAIIVALVVLALVVGPGSRVPTARAATSARSTLAAATPSPAPTPMPLPTLAPRRSPASTPTPGRSVSRQRVLAWLTDLIVRLEADAVRSTPAPAPRPTATPAPTPARSRRPGTPVPGATRTPAPRQATLAARARILRHGSRQERVVALTFDDGWGWRRCARIVSILDSRRIPATFFPNAMYVYWAPALWRDVAQRYPIGNHTAHHRSLPRLSESRIRLEIDTDERRIEHVTGVPMIKVLRPPYGAVSDRVRRVAASLGYQTILLWDTSIGDTSRRSSERTMRRRALLGDPGSVILMHCGAKETLDLLPGIIDDYLARGYRFVTVPELLGIPWKAPAPLPPLPPLPQPTFAPGP